MKQILLDTSFIITCVKQKIDFFHELQTEGFEILIPKLVVNELTGLSNSNLKARTALKILEKNNFKQISLRGGNTDDAIIHFAKQNTDLIIATLDAEIKQKFKGRVMIIRRKKKIEIN